MYLNGTQKLYQIYNSDRKYLYTLTEMKNEEWQILGNTNNYYTHLDIFFLKNIVQALALYSEKVK